MKITQGNIRFNLDQFEQIQIQNIPYVRNGGDLILLPIMRRIMINFDWIMI